MKNNLFRFLFLSVIVIAVAGCGSQAAISEEKSNSGVKELSEDQLFAGDLVRQFLAGDIPYLNDANKLFMEALDRYKNKKDPEGAIPLFVESICKNLVGKSYYELGNCYMDTKDYKSSILCYQMAEKLGYEPFSKILYNLACAYSMNEDYSLAGDYLEFALQAGYSNIENISRDPDLQPLRENMSWAYHDAIKQGMEGMSNPEKLYWLQFRKPFPKLKLAYSIDGEKASFTVAQSIPYDFEKYIAEMRDDDFSRDTGHEFYYVGEVASTDQYVAFIYAVQVAFYSEEGEEPMVPVVYRLVTFTPDGKLIDKRVIAGHEMLDAPVRKAIVNKDLTIAVTIFDLEYTKDPEEEGYINNPVKSRTKSGEEKFRIAPDGMIVSESAQQAVEAQVL